MRGTAGIGLSGPGRVGAGKGESAPSVPVDIAVGSFTELADKLGA